MEFLKCACIETLYTELPFLDRFRAAKTDGFAAVEFWSWEDKDLAAVRSAAAVFAGTAAASFFRRLPAGSSGAVGTGCKMLLPRADGHTPLR